MPTPALSGLACSPIGVCPFLDAVSASPCLRLYIVVVTINRTYKLPRLLQQDVFR